MFVIIYFVCVWVGGGLHMNICGGQRPTLRSLFFPSIIWILEFELRLGPKHLYLLNHLGFFETDLSLAAQWSASRLGWLAGKP